MRISDITVETPCAEPWDGMRRRVAKADGTLMPLGRSRFPVAVGDMLDVGERVRSCDRCGKNVYNLSAMTSEQALELLARAEGAPCVRLLKRSDGTVVTSDCPSTVGTPAVTLSIGTVTR